MTTWTHNNVTSPSVKLQALSLGNPLSSIVFYFAYINLPYLGLLLTSNVGRNFCGYVN